MGPTLKSTRKESKRWKNRRQNRKRTSMRSPSQNRLEKSLPGPNKRRRRMKIQKSFQYQPIWLKVLLLSNLTCSEPHNETPIRA